MILWYHVPPGDSSRGHVVEAQADGMMSVEALSLWQEKQRCGTEVSVKITCDVEENISCLKRLSRWPNEEMKENDQGWLRHHLITRRCPYYELVGVFYGSPSRFPVPFFATSLHRFMQRTRNVRCNAP